MIWQTAWKLGRALLGILLALWLVHWVVERNGINPREVLASVDRRFFVAAFAVYGVGVITASFRWFLLLDHIRVRLPYLTVLRLSLIGLFFNLFVPGGVGGDLIKIVYLKRESGNRYPQALLTVLLDRLLGLAGLLAIAMVAIAINQPMLAAGPKEIRAILGVVALACLGGLAFLLLFLAWPLFSRWGGSAGRSLAARVPASVRSIVAKITEALDLLRAAPAKLAGLLLLSMIGHLSATVGVYLIAYGLGGTSQLTFFECLLATQLANLMAAIPLTPGGVGNRDLVMSLLLASAGAPAALSGSIPLMVTVLLISWSALGGLALLWEKGSAGIDSESAKQSE